MNDCLDRMCSIPSLQETQYIRYRYTPHSFARFVQYVFKTTVIIIDGNEDSLLDKHMELLLSEPKFILQPVINIDLLTWFTLMGFDMSRWHELCSGNHKPYLNGISPIVRLCMVVPREIVSENMFWNAVLETNLEALQWYCDKQMTPHVAWIKRLKKNCSLPNDKWYLCCKHFTLIEASPNDPEAELLVSTLVASRALAFASRSQTHFTLRLSSAACSVMEIKEWMAKLGHKFTIYECTLADTDRVSIAYGVPQRSNSISLLSNTRTSKDDAEKTCEIKTIITTNGVTSLKENLKAEQTVQLQYNRAECKADGSIVYFSGKIIFTDKSRHLELLRRGAIVKPQPCIYSNAFILEFQLLEEANKFSISLCVVCPYPVDVSCLSLKIARKSAYIEYTICLLNETNTCKAQMRLFSNAFNSLPLAAFPRIDVNSLAIISNQSLEIGQVIKEFVALQRSSNQNMESLPFIEVLKTQLSRMLESETKAYTIISKNSGLEQNVESNVEIFVDCIRVDSDSRSLVIDVAIRLYKGILKDGSVIIESECADYFTKWKEFLALCVERARAKWVHKVGCVGVGCDGFFCECGKGLNLSERMRSELDSEHYYRAAIPLLLPNPLILPYEPSATSETSSRSVSNAASSAAAAASAVPRVSTGSATDSSSRTESELQSSLRKCEHCQVKEGSRRCAKCKSAYYCGPDCQKAAWHTHKKQCNLNTKKQ